MKIKNLLLSCSNVYTCSLFFLTFYILLPTQILAQTTQTNTYYKIISHGDKIDFGTIESGVTWTISSQDAAISPSYLNADEINGYVFKKAGVYTVVFSDASTHTEGECNHAAFPKNMLIKVSPIKMTFDFSKISFSEKIKRGSICDQIFVTVPVNVDLKDVQTAKFTIPNAMVTGVGSEITAKPVNAEVVLKNGIQLLKYQLSGVATKEAYLMFDFVDYNNNTQTYYKPEIVN
ncbi:hypothetical protein SAMN05444372_108133 [Flavobacterium micromati]|uniref:Uncharacterized protein n=1 Tax=Flavobacterium micromati TaxID=229205 RepID=A0A1M5LMN2_9FLAO|nr:hypothetical protein [Flavobacterium micromati]SHG66321.1 hypothetical protein SAMN05444372_108133 [Flavobacterium micromati]